MWELGSSKVRRAAALILARFARTHKPRPHCGSSPTAGVVLSASIEDSDLVGKDLNRSHARQKRDADNAPPYRLGFYANRAHRCPELSQPLSLLDAKLLRHPLMVAHKALTQSLS